ncbi:YqeB family protein [Microlunatus parietis]|uniref:YqeB PH domain-containing protein n=1 Tax=Microlunatus parietis TaxID=682979 RepID=A0A7Y9I9S2_9ACTN|nr:hypothetical protein [Microlunatus parietis]NYE72971.1 hypothetical protein [Microlunatus parietis]
MSEKTADEAIELRTKGVHQAILFAGAVVAGLLLGWIAPLVINWALGIGGLPFEKPMELLQRVINSWGAWVLIVVGGVAGAVFGLVMLGGLVGLRVTARDLTIVVGSDKTRFARSQVAAALFDEGHLVLRDPQDVDLIRKKLDVSQQDVLAALRRYDWPIED